MLEPTIPTEIKGGPVFTRLGCLVNVVAIILALGAAGLLNGLSRTGPPRRADPATMLALVVVGGLAVILVLVMASGPRRGLMWGFRTPTPRARILGDDLELCQPDLGCRTFALDAIGGLRPRTGRRRITRGALTGELFARDGTTLAFVRVELLARTGPSRSVDLGLLLVHRGSGRFAFVRPDHWWQRPRWVTNAGDGMSWDELADGAARRVRFVTGLSLFMLLGIAALVVLANRP